MKNIAVFCGSSLGFNSHYKNAAVALANYMVSNELSLIYGGGKIGMMGVLADTIIAQNGEVIGVIPHLLRHEEVAHEDVTKLIVTKTMSKRKVKISRLADAYIGLPGGFGTIDELFEALTLSQLGIESKPVGILNINGFFNPLLQQLDTMVTEGYLKSSNRDMLLVGETAEELFKKMDAYTPPKLSKITQKVVKNV